MLIGTGKLESAVIKTEFKNADVVTNIIILNKKDVSNNEDIKFIVVNEDIVELIGKSKSIILSRAIN